MTKGKKSLEFYYFAVFIVSVFFIISCFFFVKETIELRYFLTHAIKTDAKVSNISQVELDGGPANVITVSYEVETVTYTAESKIRSRFRYTNFSVGEKLSVFYVKDDPTNARINFFYEIYSSIMWAGFLTFCFLIFFLLILRNKDWVMEQGGGPWEYG